MPGGTRTSRQSAPTPAPAARPAPARAAAPGRPTGTVSGAPAVRLTPQPVGSTVTPDEVDISSGQLTVPEATAAEARPGRDVDLRVRLPGLAEGTIRVRKRGDTFSTTGAGTAIRLSHPALAPLADQVPTVLVVTVRENVVTGWVGVGQPGPARGTRRALVEGMLRGGSTALGLLGMTNITIPTVVNEFTGGRINLAVEGLGFRLGGYLEGTGTLRLDNQALQVEGGARVEIPGGSGGELRVRRGSNGVLGGDLRMTVAIGPATGTVVAMLDQGFVHVQGTVGYRTERMSGSITLIATDERTARDLTTRTDLDPSALPVAQPGPDNPARPGRRAFCGWGELSITLTPWLSGRARVLVNNQAQATIIGEVRPQRELILFQEREWNRRLFRVEIRAGYGIPVVGQVFVFANIGLEALARVGPGRLHNMSVTGQFSTDPRVENLFTIQGTLNISAFAGLRLRAEGGVGLTILGHDIKAGVGLNALAGIRGYVDATPRIGRRQAPGGRPEWFIAGHMEIAAQPFLGFSGDLFVELDSPWWSPAPDKRWTWPLFNLEYPLPGEFGIGADVDYVLGSRSWPTVQFGEVDFDSSKFMTDLLNDNVDRGRGGEQRRPGNWREGTGGGAPGGARGGRGGAGRGQGTESFDGPIGENMTFSDGHESHRLFIQEDARGTTPMMASEAERIETKLTRWRRNLDLLTPADRSRAETLIQLTRDRARELDERADEQKSLKDAERNARPVYERNRGQRRRRSGQNQRKRPSEVRRQVRESQAGLRDMLRELSTLVADQPFTPILRTASMPEGGRESLQLVEQDDRAKLRVSNADDAGVFVRIASGAPMSRANNQTGPNLIRTTLNDVQRRAVRLRLTRIIRNRINRRAFVALRAPMNELTDIVATVGRVMRIANLARALRINPVTPIRTLTFVSNPRRYPDGQGMPRAVYRGIFRQEMARQLLLQQRGINQLTVDRWLVNLALFRMNATLYRQMDRGGRTVVLQRLQERAAAAQVRVAGYLARLQQRRDRLQAELANIQAQNAALASTRTALARNAADLIEVARLITVANETLRRAQVAADAILRTQGSRDLAAIEVDDNGVTLPRPLREDLRPVREIRRDRRGEEVIIYYDLRIVGRQNNEIRFRDRLNPHYERLRRRLPVWEQFGSLRNGFQSFAVLHNPDQVAGGEDAFPEIVFPAGEDYTDAAWTRFYNQMRRYVGNSMVNSRIGEQWGDQMNQEGRAVMGRIPASAHPIWRNNFRFLMNPPAGTP
ncbi:polymorphic toxin type 15 domain-containing protein [Pyxidicoccus sp. MSG2]|uniref:polymorphic toxin type 15 domain-containing protein n=1 Tax=Pyxidicoccus sp. MSG2 TaxID=2996790 RepID=UPI00226D6203|nr:polymorphic toxin type 15 domain-containing protein [Pyxidicoccus sp. MSG2]MCY1015843.1 polymorphic toxin type 15 domain-containing protein [Pyxidicoccus sp. MSG2]